MSSSRFLSRQQVLASMQSTFEDKYNQIRSGGISGFYEQPRGLISVFGKEAVPFLDGMITNDMKTLEDGSQMLAAFPNAQGRLLALVRVLRQGDRFYIETEEATHEKLYTNLFRFTYAGDFFVEDISERYRYFEIFGPKSEPGAVTTGLPNWPGDTVEFQSRASKGLFVPLQLSAEFQTTLLNSGAVEISAELYETLRIESGVPKYGVDMDESTIVPELGLEGLISYTKGCYVGQEIIARIHFRGHVAKQLTGLVLSEPGAVATGDVLESHDGKNAGRITSATFSPKLGKSIALAYVRYDYLTEGTALLLHEKPVTVTNLPFVR